MGSSAKVSAFLIKDKDKNGEKMSILRARAADLAFNT